MDGRGHLSCVAEDGHAPHGPRMLVTHDEILTWRPRQLRLRLVSQRQHGAHLLARAISPQAAGISTTSGARTVLRIVGEPREGPSIRCEASTRQRGPRSLEAAMFCPISLQATGGLSEALVVAECPISHIG